LTSAWPLAVVRTAVWVSAWCGPTPLRSAHVAVDVAEGFGRHEAGPEPVSDASHATIEFGRDYLGVQFRGMMGACVTRPAERDAQRPDGATRR
jgi:hypothetical protein